MPETAGKCALGLWFVLQFVAQLSSGSNVAYSAHIGGFVCGLAMTGMAVLLAKSRKLRPLVQTAEGDAA